MKHAAPALALLILAACSGHSSNSAADAQADKLDNAAEQSTPEAATELHNQADSIRENGANGAPGAPGSSVQNAMQSAGNAQATGVQPQQTGPASTKQALPSGAEKGTPPPKTNSTK